MDENLMEHKPMHGDKGQESQASRSKLMLARPDILCSYRDAEFVTLARDGSPVCWPLAPDFKGGHLLFSTGYIFPAKARNAQRNARVAALYSDPTASGCPEDDPLVLVQGLAEVYDQDLQRNTERYVDQLLRKGPLMLRVFLRIPVLKQALVGYVTRIWIEVLPQQEYVWARGQMPPGPLGFAIRPITYSPGPGIELPQEVFRWLPRYSRLPVLAYIDQTGWPAMTRVQAIVNQDHITLQSKIQPQAGAPACLTYHRLVGNYLANDAFLLRGHFEGASKLIPEKVVGYGGTGGDRGVGSVEFMRLLLSLRKQLALQLKDQNRPHPVVRPTPQR